MPTTRATIAANATSNMAFSRYSVTDGESPDFDAHIHNLTGKFMANDQWNRNGGLCPLVPFKDVNIGSTNRRPNNLDQNVIVTNIGLLNILHPDAALSFGLYQCFHCQS
jgi:hypothetical protein